MKFLEIQVHKLEMDIDGEAMHCKDPSNVLRLTGIDRDGNEVYAVIHFDDEQFREMKKVILKLD